MNDINSVLIRLKNYFNVTDDKEIADIIGLTAANIYERKRRNSIPHEAIINALRDSDANLEHIFYGVGSDRLSPRLKLDDNQSDISVKFYPDLTASAGMGCLNGDFCEYEMITIDRSLIPDVMSKNIEAIRIHGDSMDPTIKDKDVIFIDKSQRTIINGKIFVVKFSGEVYAKRIFKAPKSLIIKSDNPQYPQYEVQIEDIEVLGQIIYNMEYLG